MQFVTQNTIDENSQHVCRHNAVMKNAVRGSEMR